MSNSKRFTAKQIIIGIYLFCNGDSKKAVKLMREHFDIIDYCTENIDFINRLEPLVYSVLDENYPGFYKILPYPPLIVLKSTTECFGESK